MAIVEQIASGHADQGTPSTTHHNTPVDGGVM
jgi:hypothetical protein